MRAGRVEHVPRTTNVSCPIAQSIGVSFLIRYLYIHAHRSAHALPCVVATTPLHKPKPNPLARSVTRMARHFAHLRLSHALRCTCTRTNQIKQPPCAFAVSVTRFAPLRAWWCKLIYPFCTLAIATHACRCTRTHNPSQTAHLRVCSFCHAHEQRHFARLRLSHALRSPTHTRAPTKPPNPLALLQFVTRMNTLRTLSHDSNTRMNNLRLSRA